MKICPARKPEALAVFQAKVDQIKAIYQPEVLHVLQLDNTSWTNDFSDSFRKSRGSSMLNEI